METILAFLGFCLLFSPAFLLELEKEYLISARVPRIIPLIRILIAKKPYLIFSKIAERSYYGKPYKFEYSSKVHSSLDFYSMHYEWNLSRSIGLRRTLAMANRILEFRLWLRIKNCRTYEELRSKALLSMAEVPKARYVFISSSLFSHSEGIHAGIKDLRMLIVNHAEDNFGMVFNQIPFLNLNLRNLRARNDLGNKFDLFYGPVIQSPLIHTLVMNPGWENSDGCKTEHEIALRSGKIVKYLIVT